VRVLPIEAYEGTHRDYKNAYQRKHRAENKELHREYSRRFNKSKRSTPEGKINHRMSSRINQVLKGGKLGRKWSTITGFSAEELKNHLESKFTNGMSWGNIGKWHIDHIIPVSFFEFSSTDDVEFKMCWRLENLQPLWAEDNLKKQNFICKEYL
jgi:hypothetical protein